MKNSHSHKHGQLSKVPAVINKVRDSVKNTAQVSSSIKKGNPPDIQKTSVDQQSTQEIKQAIKDDQSLAPVAGNIKVTVQDGAITLDGKVSTHQQMNRAAGTAIAVGVVDKVENNIEVTHEAEFKGRVPLV